MELHTSTKISITSLAKPVLLLVTLVCLLPEQLVAKRKMNSAAKFYHKRFALFTSRVPFHLSFKRLGIRYHHVKASQSLCGMYLPAGSYASVLEKYFMETLILLPFVPVAFSTPINTPINSPIRQI